MVCHLNNCGAENFRSGDPILLFLDLAPSDVATIKAEKSFLNLLKQKEALAKHAPVIEKGFWAVTGMVGEYTEVHKISRQDLLHVIYKAKHSILLYRRHMSMMDMITSTSQLI
jgi:hypothetical protein